MTQRQLENVLIWVFRILFHIRVASANLRIVSFNTFRLLMRVWSNRLQVQPPLQSPHLHTVGLTPRG